MRLLPLSLALLLFGALAMAGVSPAMAQQPAPPEASSPVMVVLDASGSMLDKADGGTKMDAARGTMHRLVDQVPAGTRLGLETYGTGTGSTDAEKTQGCQDVSVVRPPEPVDKAAYNSAVDAITPRGYTPIGQSLRTAAQTLPKEGPRSIVLVSDGFDTCSPPDPCDVAKELHQQGVDLAVHTVGYGVDSGAKDQLSCIAKATGGTYTDAPDAGSLDKVLPKVAKSALRDYRVTGTPIVGSADLGTAPAFSPGQYRDDFSSGDKKYYGVNYSAGQSLYASATMAFPRSDALYDLQSVKISLYSPSGRSCSIEDSAISQRANEGKVLTAAIYFHGVGGGADRYSCTEPGRYVLEVTRQKSDSGAKDALPLELMLGAEPGVGGDPGPPPSTDKAAFAASGGPEQAVRGGATFGTAATLPGSGRFTDTVRHGEFVYFQVPLTWGQSVAYRARFDNAAKSSPGVRVETTLYNPVRDDVDSDTGTHSGGAITLPDNTDAIASSKVRYRNREQSGAHTAHAALPGMYYIAVAVGGGDNKDSSAETPIQVHLEVSVAGQPEPGPAYVDATPEQRNGGIFGGPGGQVLPPSAQPAAATQPEDHGWPVWATIAIIAGVVVLGGGLTQFLRWRGARKSG